jgi:hypothetical protein
MTSLRLVRFSDCSEVKRPHRDDDFVVLDDNREPIGRILQIEGGPSEGHWTWSITSLKAIRPGVTNFGVACDLEAAKREFKAQWVAATVES